MSIHVKTDTGWEEVGVGSAGLPGLGGWATIESVTGTYTKHTYGDWVAYEWTDDGELTTAGGGLVDALVVGGGGGNYPSTAGYGGRVIPGLHNISSDNAIVCGKGAGRGSSQTSSGDGSSLGDIYTGLVNISANTNGFGAGAISGGAANYALPYVSGITGIEKEYAGARKSNASQTPGLGQGGSQGNFGGDGSVTVRVPKEYAQNVTENFFRWISYATVENGIVTKVTKTPDNQPYTASAQEVECDASVQEGYLYENGEFTAPKPDYSEEIEALTARLEELRNG